MSNQDNLLILCHRCVYELNQRQSWGLSDEQIKAYVDQIVGQVPTRTLERQMFQVVGYFHTDHQRVADLRTPGNAGHVVAWAWVSREVARAAQIKSLSWSRDPMVELNDLIQTVQAEVVRSLPDYRFESLLSTWLYSVTVRRLRRFHRDTSAAKRAVRPEPLEIAVERVVEWLPNEEGLLASTLVAEIQRVLSATGDPRYAQIFLMRVVGEFSNEEIAAQLRLHPSRVRALLKVARDLLRADPGLCSWAQASPPAKN